MRRERTKQDLNRSDSSRNRAGPGKVGPPNQVYKPRIAPSHLYILIRLVPQHSSIKHSIITFVLLPRSLRHKEVKEFAQRCPANK